MIQFHCGNRSYRRIGQLLVGPLAISALLFLALAAAHAAAAHASTDRAFESATRSKFSVDLAVRGTNGYAVTVSAMRRRVQLAVEGRGNAGIATYTVRGRASQRGVRARFGSLGEISVRFDPTRWTKRRRPPRGCRGKPSVQRFGFFIGKIVFKGEGGYTRVSRRRAKGSVTTRPRWRCGPREADLPDGPNINFEQPPFDPEEEVLESPELGVTSLTAGAEKAGLEFSASSLGEGGKLLGLSALFVATSTERRGRIRISRLVFLFGGADSFRTTEDPESVTVMPPKPFKGTATFERHADGTTSWAGALRVSFPGREGVSLAGRRFTAALQRL